MPKFVHHTPEEGGHLDNPEKEIYQRYIITKEGLIALRSSYYLADIIFNQIIGKIGTVNNFMGISVIAIVSWLISILFQAKTPQYKTQEKTIVLIHTANRRINTKNPNPLDSTKIEDTVIYFYK